MPLILRKLIQPLHLITDHTAELNDRVSRALPTSSMPSAGNRIALALDDHRVAQNVQLPLGKKALQADFLANLALHSVDWSLGTVLGVCWWV